MARGSADKDLRVPDLQGEHRAVTPKRQKHLRSRLAGKVGHADESHGSVTAGIDEAGPVGERLIGARRWPKARNRKDPASHGGRNGYRNDAERPNPPA